MRVIRLLFISTLCGASALAQAPGWSRGQQLLAISYDDCVRRASQSLESAGYRIDHAAGAFAVGQKSVHTAVITCNAGPEGKLWVNVVVASNGEGGGLERQQLQALMEGSRTGGVISKGGGQPPVQQGRLLSVRLNGRRAFVDWANAPTTSGSWVSIVPVGTGDGTHVGRWTYTEQKSSGTYENGPLDAGAYEARFYGDSGYAKLFDRVRFDVAPDVVGPPGQGRYVAVRVDGRAATLTWFNAPAASGSWVSIVPVGTADSAHVGKWIYTNQAASGKYESGPLSPGVYEARFYGDGGYDKLVDRVTFRID